MEAEKQASYVFGQRLQQLREEHNLNKIEIAKVLNKTRSMIGYYESGDRLPSFEVLVTLADHFGVSLDWLIGKSDIKEIGHRKEQIHLGRTVKVPIIPQTIPHLGTKISSPNNTVGYADFPVNLLGEGDYICIAIEDDEQPNSYALTKLQDSVGDGKLCAIQVGDQIRLLRIFKTNGSFVLCGPKQEPPEMLKRREFKIIGSVEITVNVHTQSDEQSIQV